MRKCLLLVALLIVSQTNFSFAQALFNAPDTVCMRQQVKLSTNVPNAMSHFWGFCSGYAFNAPVGTNMGKGNGLDNPSTIEIEKEGDNYFGFVINHGISNSLVRLEFGNSLDNTPKVTNYGSMDNVLPFHPNSLHIIKDTAKGNWHVFIAGGTSAANSSLARLDFGKSMANVPNVVNFGNYNSVMDYPVGLFVAKEAGKWYGYTLNKGTNTAVRMEFDTLISLTPKLYDIGNNNALLSPNDFAPIFYNGQWYFFITNTTNDLLSRMDLGASLATAVPFGTSISNFGSELRNPTGISIIRDCDSFHIFITNKQNNAFIRLDVFNLLGAYILPNPDFKVNNLGDCGGILSPSGMSRAIRYHDNIYMFVTNEVDSNLMKVKFQQCSNASIQSSTSKNPPSYRYDTAGIYNIYYMVDEGLPTMQVQCKLIFVLNTPPIIISNDTAICQGDTANLKVLSVNAISKTWTPAYNINKTTTDEVRVWPDYSTVYRIFMPFPAGCTVDTAIRITVHKVKSDAGPDRTLADGASTQLGGPMTSIGTNYTYTWTPGRYLSSTIDKTPIAKPPFDYTYYLEVKDVQWGCTDIDTVVVRVDCNDVNLPNAFAPQSSNQSITRFGLKNTQIGKLVYFRIFDRWGKQVFETTDPTNEWDGKVNGEYVSLGVYVWEVDGFCESGKRLKSRGNVTVIR